MCVHMYVWYLGVHFLVVATPRCEFVLKLIVSSFQLEMCYLRKHIVKYLLKSASNAIHV